jgi:hypothetical protein
MMDHFMELENLFMRMVRSIREKLYLMSGKGTDKLLMQMETPTMVSLSKIRNMDMEFTSLRKVSSITVNGKTGDKMATGLRNLKIIQQLMVSGKEAMRITVKQSSQTERQYE